MIDRSKEKRQLLEGRSGSEVNFDMLALSKWRSERELQFMHKLHLAVHA